MPKFGLAQSPEQKVDTAALLAGVGDLPALQPNETLLGAKAAQLQRIKLPAAPQGFRLELLGTDHLPVINVKGEIHPPISDTKVVLYLQLVQLKDPTFRLDISRSVMVPGQYSKEATAERVPVPAPFVIPALKEWQGQQGIFSLDPNARIVIDPTQKESLAALSEQLHQEIKVQHNLDLPLRIGKPGKGDILIRLSQSDTALGGEGYRLDIGENIELTAPHERGLFWGTRTLLQLLEDTLKLPYGKARDYPSFAVRGLVLDAGRKFFTLDFLKDYVKLLSYYKLNDFQIHLNDNGFKKYFGDRWDSTYSAFRLENSTYPGLTAKDGHYTKQEFRDLQQLGRQYGVNIVPEIDVPAHALAFSKVIPEIGSKKYGLDHLDLHNPKTDTVVQNVFREYLAGPNPVFSGQVVDIGTDEYAKADGEAFRGFTDRMIRFVQGYGKQVRLWGALTWAKGNTPVQVKGVTMNTWYNGYAEPTAMKKLGYNQISTPDGWLYIVPAAGYYYDYLNLPMLYHRWTPSQIGDVKFPSGDPTILGGAFAVWNDIVGNGISEPDVTDRVFPALQVLSQKMWGGEDTVMNFTAFNELRQSKDEGPGLNLRARVGTYTPGADSLVFSLKDFTKLSDKVLHKVSWMKLKKEVLMDRSFKSSAFKTNPKVLAFSGKDSYVQLPIEEIGYDYTVSFYIYPDEVHPSADAAVFQSKHAGVKLSQIGTGRLGFSREGYDYSFNFKPPSKQWTHIVITGTAKGTALYVNGQLQDRLYDHRIEYNDRDKSKVRKVETLVFPLEKLGGFKGKIGGLQVWNRLLKAGQIEQL